MVQDHAAISTNSSACLNALPVVYRHRVMLGVASTLDLRIWCPWQWNVFIKKSNQNKKLLLLYKKFVKGKSTLSRGFSGWYWIHGHRWRFSILLFKFCLKLAMPNPCRYWADKSNTVLGFSRLTVEIVIRISACCLFGDSVHMKSRVLIQNPRTFFGGKRKTIRSPLCLRYWEIDDEIPVWGFLFHFRQRRDLIFSYRFSVRAWKY